MKVGLVVLTVAGCLTACAARAETETLVYHGSAFTHFTQQVYPPDGTPYPPPLGSLVGEMEISSPLGPNITDASVVPLSWSFYDRYDPYDPTLTSDWLSTIGDGEYGSASFKFSTLDGQITNWDVSLTGG